MALSRTRPSATSFAESADISEPMASLPQSAAAWWDAAVRTRHPDHTPQRRRATTLALGTALQLRVRAEILAHPGASQLFTVVRGGTDSDHHNARDSRHLWTGRALLLWAEAASLLNTADPLRRVTVAHAWLLARETAQAIATLTDALDRFPNHPARFVMWQNLGVALSLSGDPEAALAAYRAASGSPGRVERELAAVSLCIVGAKTRCADAVRLGYTILSEWGADFDRDTLRAAIQARRRRGNDRFWAFDDGDVDALAAAAPELGVTLDWRVA